MPSYRVLVCQFPGNQSTHPAASDYLGALYPKMLQDPRIGPQGTMVWRVSDTPITMTRNQAIVAGYAHKADYVVMIDSDMDPDIVAPEAGGKPFWETSWEFMLDNPYAGMIAAPYCGPGDDQCVYVFRWQTMKAQEPNPNARIEMFDRHTAAFKTGIEQVAALPTGLCIINMRAVSEMKKPWFDYEWADHKGVGEVKCQTCGHPVPGERSRKASTEDVFFSRNMQSVGLKTPDGKLVVDENGKSVTKWPIFCNWDAWAGHMKLQRIGPPQKLPMDHFPAQQRRWAEAAPDLKMPDPYPATTDVDVKMTASDTNPQHYLNADIGQLGKIRYPDGAPSRFTFPIATDPQPAPAGV